jgi:hypothetical protein
LKTKNPPNKEARRFCKATEALKTDRRRHSPAEKIETDRKDSDLLGLKFAQILPRGGRKAKGKKIRLESRFFDPNQRARR